MNTNLALVLKNLVQCQHLPSIGYQESCPVSTVT